MKNISTFFKEVVFRFQKAKKYKGRWEFLNTSGLSAVIMVNSLISLVLLGLLLKSWMNADYQGVISYLGVITMATGAAVLAWRTIVFPDDEEVQK